MVKVDFVTEVTDRLYSATHFPFFKIKEGGGGAKKEKARNRDEYAAEATLLSLQPPMLGRGSLVEC